jgi:hypothetical protein
MTISTGWQSVHRREPSYSTTLLFPKQIIYPQDNFPHDAPPAMQNSAFLNQDRVILNYIAPMTVALDRT